MSAIGLFGPINHFLYVASITFVSGSQVLYGRYLARGPFVSDFAQKLSDFILVYNYR